MAGIIADELKAEGVSDQVIAQLADKLDEITVEMSPSRTQLIERVDEADVESLAPE